MTSAEIKNINLEELKELLIFNTTEYKYDLTLMEHAYEDMYAAFLEHRNSLLERRILWHTILQVFFGLNLEIIEAIEDKLNWYNFILWCEEHFASQREIQFFISMYAQYRQDKNSLINLMLELVDVLSGAINDMSPESIQSLLDQLGENLNNLPDIIKDNL